MATAKIGALTIGYDTRGKGEPLLLIPGFGMTRHMWANEFCDAMAARNFTVVRMDNRDVGESTRLKDLGVPNVRRIFLRSLLGLGSKVPYRLEDMASDAAGLMRELGFPRFHVAGVSMGGMIAQTLAFAHPDQVASLASIMSTPGGRLNSFAKLDAFFAILKPSPIDPEEQKEHLVSVFRVLSGGSTPFEDDRLRALADLHVATKPSPSGNARQFAAILESGTRRGPLLRSIRAKTVVIHGALDPLLPRRGARATQRAIAGSSLVIVPNMGHDLPTGAYAKVIDAIAVNAANAKSASVS